MVVVSYSMIRTEKEPQVDFEGASSGGHISTTFN